MLLISFKAFNIISLVAYDLMPINDILDTYWAAFETILSLSNDYNYNDQSISIDFLFALILLI